MFSIFLISFCHTYHLPPPYPSSGFYLTVYLSTCLSIYYSLSTSLISVCICPSNMFYFHPIKKLNIIPLQYTTLQYSTVQYTTVQYSTVQYSTVQYCTVQNCTVQNCTVQNCTVQNSTVQNSTLQNSTVKYTTVL